ncbi:MAG: DUF1802 family protein [Isosphaeraceae bacterium]
MTNIPETCDIAFKEWAGICQALADGRQTIILRKGGIAEDRGAFVPEHRAFWLYPTHVHEAQQGLRTVTSPRSSELRPDQVAIGTFAVVESVSHIDRLEDLGTLAEFHIWTEETVLKRFTYRKPGLWVLGVRIGQIPIPWVIDVTADQTGCKSWVPLEAPLATEGLVPALDDGEAARRLDRLQAVLNVGKGRPR